MGKVLKKKAVRLIASIIFKDKKYLDKAEKSLKKLYGPIDALEKILPFDYTDYYCDEMGSGLKRKIISFEKLIDKEKLAKTKLDTNSLEDSLSIGGKRTVNIDPGYVTEAKLVLLTTKDYTHRVYIGRGIFAEVTLFFKEGSFRSWPWTYPDYASDEMISYFNKVRELYVNGARS